MVKGGVYFIDLTDVTVGGDAVTIPGIWDAMKRTYGKIIACTVNIGDSAIMKFVPDVIYQSDVVQMNVYIVNEGTIVPATVTITDEDSVQIVVPE